MIDRLTIIRFEIVAAYMDNQTQENWQRLIEKVADKRWV